MADVFLEMQRNGAFLKCTAIDSVTGEEAVAMGPVSDPEGVKRVAVAKLRAKMGQRTTPQRPQSSQSSSNFGDPDDDGPRLNIKI